MVSFVIYVAAFLATSAQASTERVIDAGLRSRADRAVVITIDDLPYVGGGDALEDAVRVTDAILAGLERHDVPALGFVTGSRVFVTGQVDARFDLLRRWVTAGASLENHSFSHRSFQRTPLDQYQDDAVMGELAPGLVMAESDRAVRFYRHPYNHTGRTAEDKAAFESFMEHRGVRIAPFTIEHADYVFNLIYVAARRRGDTAEMQRIGEAYLAQLDRAFDFWEALAEETFGRPIPQVLLIHANDINADYLEAMLRRLGERGYAFVSMDDAISDAAYASPEEYVGPTGISWLHRWRIGFGMEDRLRDEPDPPAWVIDAYRELQGN